MTSESVRTELWYPAAHRNRHTPRLCKKCAYPLTSAGRCTRCTPTAMRPSSERPVLWFPDRLERLERMERAAEL